MTDPIADALLRHYRDQPTEDTPKETAVSTSLISLGEAGVLARMAPAKLFACVARGDLAGERIGGRWFVERDSFDAWLAALADDGNWD